MLTRFISTISSSKLLFRSAYLASTAPTGYYKLLGVASDATLDQIGKAYKELTTIVSPDSDPSRFKKISEAFVILSHHKSRDAYDSLLKGRRTSFLSDPEIKSPQVEKRSYISQRKLDSNKSIRERLNLDQFGRYKGGLPTKSNSNKRGGGLNSPGEFHKRHEIDNEMDTHPDHTIVDAETKESFQNFHQDERQARTMRWTWYTMEVDRQFFFFNSFRKNWWNKVRLAILIGFILPVFYRLYANNERMKSEEELKMKMK